MGSSKVPARRAAALVLGALAIAVTAGCGSGQVPSTATRHANTAVPPPQSAPTTTRTVKPTRRAATVGSVAATATVARAKQPAGVTEHESSSPPPDPCRLVTAHEASAIVGGRVAAPRTAMLGPTCIYQAAGRRQSVTLSVLRMPVAAATRRSPTTVTARVAGRRAYCVSQGTLRMLVPLSGGKVLTVMASCPIAARFAARAIVRLGG